MKTAQEQRTIRSGSLSDYSFYYSNRQRSGVTPTVVARPHKAKGKAMLLVALLLVVGAGVFVMQPQTQDTPVTSTSGTIQTATPSAAPEKTATTAAATALNPAKDTKACAGNTLDKFIKVSVDKRHLWACEGEKVAHNSAVITGMEKHASTLTPRGTYKVYAKQADTALSGSDEAGTWRVPVSYWMPFLDNEHGTYGFHDATWRKDSEFGTINADTSDTASHGCVEMPLASQKWLYEWAPVGTVVSVED